jgi:hypothetical protein
MSVVNRYSLYDESRAPIFLNVHISYAVCLPSLLTLDGSILTNLTTSLMKSRDILELFHIGGCADELIELANHHGAQCCVCVPAAIYFGRKTCDEG